MKSLLFLPIALLLFLAPALRAEEEKAPRGDLVGTIAVPSGYDAKTIQSAIVRTFLGRSWTVKSQEDGIVVAYLNHRGIEATVTATYDDKSIQLFNYAWKVDREGRRIKRAKAEGWMGNLKKDLPRRLAAVVP